MRRLRPFQLGSAVAVLIGLSVLAWGLSRVEARAGRAPQFVGPTPTVPRLPSSLPLARPPNVTVGPIATLAPSSPPPLPTRVALPPSATPATYRDANFGFSFQYPSNWFIDAPRARLSQVPQAGYVVTVRNYDPPVQLPRGPLPEEIKIQLLVSPGLSAFSSLDDWMTHALPTPIAGEAITVLPSITVSGVTVKRAIDRSARDPDGTIGAILGKGDTVYAIGASPASTLYAATFDAIVQSFSLP